MSKPESSPSAEELFAEYLCSLEEGPHTDFDAWVARHPDRERELRGLHAGHRVVDGYVAGERLGLREEHGDGACTSANLGVRHERSPARFQGTFVVGDRIGDFLLLEPLGSGGMGQVWKATQLALSRPVALKLVRPGSISLEILERFAREARAGGRLSHPAIVAVHGFGESDGVHWIAMELVQDGRTLRGFIDRMRTLEELPRDYYLKAAALVADLADGLQAAHDANVIHRDIKPQNILITPEDRPKLTDFGLARITDESALTRTGEFAGTYLYMSPEQVAAGRMGIDHRSDVFSLGVVLYELLGLVRPFEGDTTHQVAAKILTEEPPDLLTVRSRVPRDLALIAGKALEKKRQERYQSMAELRADLLRYLAHEPVHAKPPSPLRRTLKWIERHPTRSVAAALLALGLTGTAITSVWALRNADAARAERDRVFGLVSSLELRRLREEAGSDALWPALPEMRARFDEWLARAQAAIAALHPDPTTGDPGHLAVLAELRGRGEPIEREPVVEEAALSSARARTQNLLEADRRAQRVRRGDVVLESGTFEPDPEVDDAQRLLRSAWSLVAPGRVEFGREQEGYELARAALLMDPPESLAPLAFEVWCEAALTIGLEAEALDEIDHFGDQLEGRHAANFAPFAADFRSRAEHAEELTAARILAREQELSTSARGSVAPIEWRFADDKDRWWHEHLEGLVADIEAFADPAVGPIHGSAPPFGWGIERRRAWAERVGVDSLESAAARAAWAEACASIADVSQCPRYAGLRIEPQVGLLPIGRDGESGLWEFACLQSGEPPMRGPDGRLRRNASMGIVLVLIPGGDYGETHLDPFFLSKFEMTQAQWEHVAMANPSTFTSASADQPGITAFNPVETVSWIESRRVLRMLDLDLPTERQWCYAAGWSPAPAAPGRPWEDADDANLGDATPNDSKPTRTFDGYRVHAPVGSFPANAFGLHDMRGNVSEWSLDRDTEADAHESAGTIVESARVYLGSTWSLGNQRQEAFRFSDQPAFSSASRGLRGARRLVQGPD